VVAKYLLDVNVLLALSWPSHLHHLEAHRWFHAHRKAGFATCPLTQLGFLRISSNPKFTKEPVTPHAAMELLARITAIPEHVFWPEPLSCQEAFEGAGLIIGHKQLTDLYLLGLARENHGILATFDSNIPSRKVFREYVEFICSS
jgi:toxin-antitoxin system PIN domain toxin